MQVFQEAGGIVVPNEKLRNMRIGVDLEDKRRVEFAVYNLKFGPPLLCDVTQVSPGPLDQNGNPHPKCAVKTGVAIEIAENRKISTYREAAQDAGQVKLGSQKAEYPPFRNFSARLRIKTQRGMNAKKRKQFL